MNQRPNRPRNDEFLARIDANLHLSKWLSFAKIPSKLFSISLFFAISAAQPLAANPSPPSAETAQAYRKLVEEAYVASGLVCAGGIDTPPAKGARQMAELRWRSGAARHHVRDWRTPQGRLMRVRQTDRSGQPRLFFVAIYDGDDGARPALRVVRDDRCGLRGGEHIIRDAQGVPQALMPLGRDMRPRARALPFNPALPSGLNAPTLAARDTDEKQAAVDGDGLSCTPVGILDNGVNYLIPRLANRLARRGDGRLVGYDFWEGDPLPFDFGVPENDLDLRLSSFDPPNHGTAVASVLLADAGPGTCLAPFRYSPRDGADSVGSHIDRIAAEGVRIVVLASGRERPWPAFRDAIARHPEMLFISAAGNEGRDLTRRPLYPMAYAAPNHLVVAATDSQGAIWPQSNKGAGLIELGVPAVEVTGYRFDGNQTRLTGTSFASPRVGALAAMLLKAEPFEDGAALKARVLAILSKAALDQASNGAARTDLQTVSEQQFRRLLARISE